MPHQKINNLLGLMKETGVDLPDYDGIVFMND